MSVVSQPDFFTSPLWSLNHKVEEVAKSYEQQGYDVVFTPSGAQLPAFLHGFYPDAIATRGEERVIVEVKSAAKVRPDSYWLDFARSVRQHRSEGWQFRLLIDPQPADSWESITLEDVDMQLQQALQVIGEGSRNNTALLLAWAALEAAMRWAIDVYRVEVPDYSSPRLISNLYAEGILEREEYDLLVKYLRIRYSIAHGFRSQPDSEDIKQICDIAKRLAQLGERAS